MKNKLYALLVIFIFLGCHEASAQNINSNANPAARDTTKDYLKILTEREKESAEKQYKTGDLIKTIPFYVLTDNKKEFKDGTMPWVSIAKPEKDIPLLIDRNRVVIQDSLITIIIDYPLTNECKFQLRSKNGFTRVQLIKAISENYYKLYDEEEKTATVKTIPLKQRTTMYNRNQTNGKYGIWGHDIEDLALSEILVYKTTSGEVVLALRIES